MLKYNSKWTISDTFFLMAVSEIRACLCSLAPEQPLEKERIKQERLANPNPFPCLKEKRKGVQGEAAKKLKGNGKGLLRA